MDTPAARAFRQALGGSGLVYLVGIKGTGMCALAEFLTSQGVALAGSDGKEVFYTDAILRELDIPFHESFDARHITEQASEIALVVHSDAYSFEKNPEMARARALNIPVCKYSDALGAYSEGFDSSGIAGVHGKTTLTALAGTLIRGAGLPAQVLTGGAVQGFGNRSTLNLGNKYFVAETDEYRRHFLAFVPRRVVLTAVEPDHQDYFPDYPSIQGAFLEYLRKIPPGGELFFCADDPGASETAGIIAQENRGIKIIPYGFTAPGDWGIEGYKAEKGSSRFRVRFFPGKLEIRIPGKHSCQNAAGALALTSSLAAKEFGTWDGEREENVRQALLDFRGAKRRSEILGEAGGILFMDDYGHHPTAIKTTLEGLKAFYGRRLVLSFMSHTYTRTAALLDDFAAAFETADFIILHKIYGSAREVYAGGVSGRTLFEKARVLWGDRVFYVEEWEDAFDVMKELLCPGDLLVTMGAGDNWKLGQKLYAFYNGGKEP